MVYSASLVSQWNLQQLAMNHPKHEPCRLKTKTPKWNCAPTPLNSLKQSTQSYSIYLRLYVAFQIIPKFTLEGIEIGKRNDPLLLTRLKSENANWDCAPALSILQKQMTQAYRGHSRLSIAFYSTPKFTLEGIKMC